MANPVEGILNSGGTRIITDPNEVRNTIRNIVDPHRYMTPIPPYQTPINGPHPFPTPNPPPLPPPTPEPPPNTGGGGGGGGHHGGGGSQTTTFQTPTTLPPGATSFESINPFQNQPGNISAGPGTSGPSPAQNAAIYAYNLQQRGLQGGVYTSTGQFYPTTNPNTLLGFQEGQYVPAGEDKKFYIIGRNQQGYSTKEGPVVTEIPKQQFSDTEVSRIPPGVIAPTIVPGVTAQSTVAQSPTFAQQVGASSSYLFRVLTLGDVGQEVANIGGQLITSAGKTIGYLPTQLPYYNIYGQLITKPLDKQIQQNFGDVTPSLSDKIITASLPLSFTSGIVGKVIGPAFGAYGTYSIGKEVITNPEKVISNPAKTGVDVVLTYLALREPIYYGKAKLTETPAITREVPILREPAVEEQSRQRATFLPEVINAQGQSLGIVLGKNKQGEYISLGGLPEKGETILQAVFRESKEETGLLQKDVSNAQPVGRLKLSTAEETQNIVTGRITEETFKKLTPSSDITELKIFKPEEFRQITGPTAEAPTKVQQGNILRVMTNTGDDVRITEAVMLGNFNKLSEYTEPFKTSIVKVPTPSGDINVYMQSRYNVPGEIQEKFFDDRVEKAVYKYANVPFKSKKISLSGFEENEYNYLKTSEIVDQRLYNRPQLLVHGNPTGDFVLDDMGNLIILKEKNTRGGAPFYFQLPERPGGKGYLGFSYLKGKGEDVEFALLPKSARPTVLYGKFVLDKETFNIAKQLKAEGVGYKEAQSILNERAKPGTIGATAKTAYGIETEASAYDGGFEFTGKKQVTFLEGTPIEFKQIRRIRSQARIKELNELYNEYHATTNSFMKESIAARIEAKSGIRPEELLQRKTRYVSPAELLRPNYSEEQVNKAIREASVPSVKESSSTILREGEPSTRITRETSTFTERQKEPPVRISYKEPGIPLSPQTPYEPPKEPGRPFIPSRPKEPIVPLTENRILSYSKAGGFAGDIKGRRKGGSRAYNVLLRRQGKYIPVARGLPRGRALQFGETATLKSIARTFKLAESGTTELEDVAFRPDPNIFRTYQVRKGKALPLKDVFIQKQSKALTTKSERMELEMARQSKQMNKAMGLNVY